MFFFSAHLVQFLMFMRSWTSLPLELGRLSRIYSFKENWVMSPQLRDVISSLARVGTLCPSPPLCAWFWSGLSLHNLVHVVTKCREFICVSNLLFRRHCFLIFIHIFSIFSSYTLSMPSSKIIPEPWEESVYYRCPVCAWVFHILLFSEPWPVVVKY